MNNADAPLSVKVREKKRQQHETANFDANPPKMIDIEEQVHAFAMHIFLDKIKWDPSNLNIPGRLLQLFYWP